MNDALSRRWGRNIRQWRQFKDMAEGRGDRRKGLSGSGIDHMAKALEVAPETVSRWETGKLVPRDEMKINIAEYLGVPPESLFPLVREVSS